MAEQNPWTAIRIHRDTHKKIIELAKFYRRSQANVVFIIIEDAHKKLMKARKDV